MGSVMSVVVFFFFQAEDGIRDLVRSRGLGDVYKRQAMLRDGPYPAFLKRRIASSRGHLSNEDAGAVLAAVSYTHLTLPTIYSV